MLKITGQTSTSKTSASTNISGSGGFKSQKVEEVVLKSKPELSLVIENPYAETCVSTEENHKEIPYLSYNNSLQNHIDSHISS